MGGRDLRARSGLERDPARRCLLVMGAMREGRKRFWPSISATGIPDSWAEVFRHSQGSPQASQRRCTDGTGDQGRSADCVASRSSSGPGSRSTNVLDRLPQREQSEAKELRVQLSTPRHGPRAQLVRRSAPRYGPPGTRKLSVLRVMTGRMVTLYDF